MDDPTRSPGKAGYLSKHPCEHCGVGYGECAAGWVASIKCCASCGHPTRWQPNAWTEEDLAEMNAGRQPG